jgi:xanthine dehydrogenase accessory factor
VLPRPSLVILGASPVALALSALGRQFGYHVTIAAPPADLAGTPDADSVVAGFEAGDSGHGRRYVVVSTQGRGDEAALRAALREEADYFGFVGSRRKMAALREKLAGTGADLLRLERVKAPAGLDIGAITPDEIALSIMAEIVATRRSRQRATVEGR